MYLPLTLLPLLPLLHATALPSFPDFTLPLNPRQSTNSTNNPSNPGFMTGTNQTVSAWTRAGCNNNTMGHQSTWFPDILYNENNHALVVSYMLGRDMLPNEQLDMSMAYPDGHSVPSADGTMEDWECALYQFTASPDKTSGETLKANTCYTAGAPVTCFSMWRTS